MGERFVVLGLARARSGWFQTVGQWAASAALPVEFLRCVSAAELRARLGSGRSFSAVLVGDDVPGLDRDLVAEATTAGSAVLVVEDGGGRDHRALGAAAVLPSSFGRDELLDALTTYAHPVGAEPTSELPDPSERATADGWLVAVTGPGGTGASTVAVALAQGLARGARAAGRRRGGRPARPAGSVLLADLCRHADQALLHDTGSVVPGLQEIVEAHRTGTPSPAEIRAQTFEVPARGYRLLLGLRRPRHWVGLQARAVAAALDGLRAAADVVVADVESEVEGEAETGSVDVEDRHLLARSALAGADAVVVVGEPSLKGLGALVRTLTELLAFGVEVGRVVPVLNRAPRSPRSRAELTRALHELVRAGAPDAAGGLAGPTFLPERRLDDVFRDGMPVPRPLPDVVAGAVRAVLQRVRQPPPSREATPEPVTPGSLSGFTSRTGPWE